VRPRIPGKVKVASADPFPVTSRRRFLRNPVSWTLRLSPRPVRAAGRSFRPRRLKDCVRVVCWPAPPHRPTRDSRLAIAWNRRRSKR